MGQAEEEGSSAKGRSPGDRRRRAPTRAGWQKPRRGWPERVAGARRRGSRVAASSQAPLSRGGGGGGFLCLDTSLARSGSCRGRSRQERC